VWQQYAGVHARSRGHGPKPFFWIDARARPAVNGAHVAFGARAPEQVDAFHAATLAAGSSD
jgi:hypothetical protein